MTVYVNYVDDADSRNDCYSDVDDIALANSYCHIRRTGEKNRYSGIYIPWYHVRSIKVEE